MIRGLRQLLFHVHNEGGYGGEIRCIKYADKVDINLSIYNWKSNIMQFGRERNKTFS